MFLKTGYTPAGVPAVYSPTLAGTDLGDVGQSAIDDLLNSLPDVIKTGGDAASSIIRAINPTLPAIPSSYAPSASSFGGSGLLLIAAGGLLLFALSKKRR